MLETILRRPQVERATGLTRSSIYERMAAGTFPKPVPLGGRAVGWLEPEIIAWQQKRKAERDRPAAPPKRQRASKRSSLHSSRGRDQPA
jgi:prophage regulatory protein